MMATKFMTASTLVLALTAGAAYAQSADTDAVANEPTVVPPSDEQVIVEQQSTQTLTYELIGADVMHPEHGNIGTLEALLFDSNDQIVGGVVSVGGFLGLGAKEVALSWDEFDVRAEDEEVYIDLTKEQLEAAPSFMDRADIEAERAAQQAQSDMQNNNAMPVPALDPEADTQFDGDEPLDQDEPLEEQSLSDEDEDDSTY
ncbi:MAG: PRC-barrel domain-containing protein [Rhodospirillaceae bacterium]|nr:PRC-barrel domain-containing protein [Rhodospirillaceae bacterium]